MRHGERSLYGLVVHCMAIRNSRVFGIRPGPTARPDAPLTAVGSPGSRDQMDGPNAPTEASEPTRRPDRAGALVPVLATDNATIAFFAAVADLDATDPASHELEEGVRLASGNAAACPTSTDDATARPGHLASTPRNCRPKRQPSPGSRHSPEGHRPRAQVAEYA